MPAKVHSDSQSDSNSSKHSSDDDDVSSSSSSSSSDYSSSSASEESESSSQASTDASENDRKVKKHTSKNLLDGSLSEGERFLERDFVTVQTSKNLPTETAQNTPSRSSACEQLKNFESESFTRQQQQESKLPNGVLTERNVGLESDSPGLADGEGVSRAEFEKLKVQNQQLVAFISKIQGVFADSNLIKLLGDYGKNDNNQINQDIPNEVSLSTALQMKIPEFIPNEPQIKHGSNACIRINKKEEKNDDDGNDGIENSCSCSSHYEEIPVVSEKGKAKSSTKKASKKTQKSKEILKRKNKSKTSKLKSDSESMTSDAESNESSSSSESEESVCEKSKRHKKKKSSGSKKLIEKLKNKLKKAKSKTNSKDHKSHKKSKKPAKIAEKSKKRHAQTSKNDSGPLKKKSKRP